MLIYEGMDILYFFASLDFSNPLKTFWFILINGGWILIAVFVIRGLWEMWMNEIQGNYAASIQYVLLAINVPKQTEQTPKAVENIFAHLEGLYSGYGNLIDKYWKGKFQENFAVEIISRGGFIQYYVRIPVKYRDILEAAVFAQYPDAEIVEASDYTNEYPQDWPDETYDMWGAELSLSKDDVYPIRTYPAFYDQISQAFKDPLASLLEFLGTLRPGESIFIQIPLVPTGGDWKERSMNEIKKLIGAPEKPKPKSRVQKITDAVLGLVTWPLEKILGISFAKPAEPKKDPAAPPSIIQHLSPAERSVVEQIGIKASKPGFAAKVRVICIAPKELMNRQRMVGGVMGSFKQFNTQDMNAFGVDKYTATKANYFRVAQRVAVRQRKVWENYRGRSSGGGPTYILNIEEVASIWHFPMIDIKAPLISKAEVKRAEPPSRLPLSEEPVYRAAEKVVVDIPPPAEGEDADKQEPPSNIPFV